MRAFMVVRPRPRSPPLSLCLSHRLSLSLCLCLAQHPGLLKRRVPQQVLAQGHPTLLPDADVRRRLLMRPKPELPPHDRPRAMIHLTELPLPPVFPHPPPRRARPPSPQTPGCCPRPAAPPRCCCPPCPTHTAAPAPPAAPLPQRSLHQAHAVGCTLLLQIVPAGASIALRSGQLLPGLPLPLPLLPLHPLLPCCATHAHNAHNTNKTGVIRPRSKSPQAYCVRYRSQSTSSSSTTWFPPASHPVRTTSTQTSPPRLQACL